MRAALSERTVVVLLVDGPCAGTYATVRAFGFECWQRVGKPGGTSVETQLWARYEKNLLCPGEYRYAGQSVTTDELGRMLKAHTDAGHSYGQTEGA